MEGWKDGGMEGWRDGRMEGWKGGKTKCWSDRGMEGRRLHSDTTTAGVQITGCGFELQPERVDRLEVFIGKVVLLDDAIVTLFPSAAVVAALDDKASPISRRAD